MELKYFIVKEEVLKQRMFREYVRTKLMIIDPLTKRLQLKIFKKHIQRMDVGFPFE